MDRAMGLETACFKVMLPTSTGCYSKLYHNQSKKETLVAFLTKWIQSKDNVISTLQGCCFY